MRHIEPFELTHSHSDVVKPACTPEQAQAEANFTRAKDTYICDASSLIPSVLFAVLHFASTKDGFTTSVKMTNNSKLNQQAVQLLITFGKKKL